jgi:hypothetical protein
MTRSSTLADIADRAWQYRLVQSPYLQLRNGVPVTKLPAGTLEEAEAELGDDFDIRDFHEVILGPGALPMTEVEASVERYIEAKREMA